MPKAENIEKNRLRETRDLFKPKAGAPAPFAKDLPFDTKSFIRPEDDGRAVHKPFYSAYEVATERPRASSSRV